MTQNSMGRWLIDRLADEDEEVRLQAREEILRMGVEAVPALAEAIDCELIPEKALPFVRGTLAAIKPRFPGEKPDILIEAALTCTSTDVCDAASQALVNFGAAATEPLLALLTQGNKMIYSAMADALAQIAKVDPSVMPAVIKAMDDENWIVREGAVHVLRLVESKPLDAIAPLIRSLREEDEDRRNRIIWTLELYGSAAVPALLESLRSPDWCTRAGSAGALRMIEVARKVLSDREPYFDMGVVPGLVEALSDERIEVLRAAANALSTIGPPEANPAAPALLKILQGRNPLTFPVAASELQWIQYSEDGLGPELIDTLASLEDELIDALIDRDSQIQAAATDLLWRIRVPVTFPLVLGLLAAMEDEDGEVRFQAARAMAHMAPRFAARGVPILHSALMDARDWDRMRDAIEALAQSGHAAAVAIPAIIDSLQYYFVADAAAAALARMGPLASAAVPELLQMLRKWDEDTQAPAAVALAAIGPESASAAVRILIDRLRQTDEYQRYCAAECLSLIGMPAAEAAIPAMLELATEESERLRFYAGVANEWLDSDRSNRD